MPSNFPGAIDSFTNPLSNSALNSPSHSGQHSDLNDAVNKVEQYMGLVKVIPTGATNGTVGATGTVTIGNAVSSVTVSGAFSSLYDAYRIIITGGTISATTVLKLTLGGAATNYFYTFLYASFATNTALADNGNNTTSFLYAAQGHQVGGLSGDISVTNPFLTKYTYVHAPIPAGNGTYAGTLNGTLADVNSYTAFTLAPISAATMTGGTIRVYGYRN